MENTVPNQIITQLKFVVRQRKLVILLCLILVFLPVLIYNETTAPIYEASTSLIFEDISNPLKTTYDPLRRYHRETFVLNRIEEIKSRALAEEVADALPIDLINRFPFPDDVDPRFNKSEFMVSYIQEAISTTVVRNTDVIKIKFSTEDPDLSFNLANKTADALRQRNLKLKQREVGGVREFIEAQVKIFQDKLNNSELALMQFKELNRITFLERESAEILRRITDAEIKYNQVKTQRQSTQQRLIAIKEKLSRDRAKLVPTATDVSSPTFVKLKERLVELQIQYTGLQVQDYSENHPKMIELREDIEQTKESLNREALNLVKGENLIDPLTQISAYLKESIKYEIDLEELKARERALKQILVSYETNLKSLPEKERELAGLTRAKNVNETLFISLMQKREDARISEAQGLANIGIIDRAKLPTEPVRPNKALNLGIGAMIGLFLGFGIAFFQDSLNKTLRTTEELEKLTSWQVLAAIPKIEIGKNGHVDVLNNSNQTGDDETRKGMVSNLQPTAAAAEAFRVLRTNLQFLNSSQKFKSILVTSVSSGDGKSTTTTNLGIALTKLGLRILIIDADLRRPKAFELLKVAREPGLADVLLNHHNIVNDLVAEELEKEFYSKDDKSPVWSNIQNLKSHNKDVEILEENFKEFSDGGNGLSKEDKKPRMQYRNLLKTSLIESIQATHIKNLKILTSGKAVDNPSEILSTTSLKLLLEEVNKKFDLVLIDSPPLLVVPDSMIMSSLVDGVLVVIEYNKNQQNMVMNAQKFLEKTGCNVIGAVLNKVDLQMMYKDQDYYYYG